MSTSASAPLLQFAISNDQSLVAIVPPTTATSNRLVVQVYQVLDTTTDSCQLQLTLTHTTASDASSSLSLQEIQFCGTSHILARLGTSQVIAWDLNRGVLSHTLQARDEEVFLAVAAAATTASSTNTFCVLTRQGTSSPKLVVQEYASNTGKLLRKIKSGKQEGNLQDVVVVDATNGHSTNAMAMAMLCVSATRLVVQTAPGVLRVMDYQTGKKIGKIKSSSGSTHGRKGEEGNGLVFRSMILSQGTETNEEEPQQQLVASFEGCAAVIYNVTTCQELLRIPSTTGSASDISNSYRALQIKGTILLADNVVFSLNGSSFDKETTLESSGKPFAPFVTRDSSKIMALIYEKTSGCYARTLNLNGNDDVPSVFNVTEDTPATKASQDDNTSKKTPTKGGNESKRKATDPMVLGPGQAGLEMAPPPTKKPKASGSGGDDDNNDDQEGEDDEIEMSAKDVSIAERLKQLASAMEEEDDDDDDEDDDENENGTTSGPSAASFKAKQATTESLKELLSQALQSGEDSLLELALGVSDIKVISKTLMDMEPSLLPTLLSKLTTRVASNPFRAEQLALWLSQCLKHGSSRIQPHQLAPLRNLLFERIESFPDLLRLEGRLSLMCDVE